MKAPIYIVPDDIPDQQMLFSNILAPVISYDTVHTNYSENEQTVQTVQSGQSGQPAQVQPVQVQQGQQPHEWQTQSTSVVEVVHPTSSPPITTTHGVNQKENPYILYNGTRYVLQPVRNNSL